MQFFRDRCEGFRAAMPARPKMLLVQPPLMLLSHFSRDIAAKRGYYSYPPTGLQYLYEAVKHRSVDVRILDLNFEILKTATEDPDYDIAAWIEPLRRTITEWKPELIGVTCIFDVSMAPFLEMLRLVREIAPGAVLLTGGIIPSFSWKELLDQNLSDFVITRDGEQRLNFLLDHLTGVNLDTPPTSGVHFNLAGRIHETEGESVLQNLAGNLIDSYALVPIENYWRYGSLNPFTRMSSLEQDGFAPVQFSRGCRANCTFCSVRGVTGRGVRHRPVKDVLDEIEFLVREKGVYHIEWLDDDMLFHRREVKEMLQGIIDRKLKIRWASNNGLVAASIDDELFGLMRASGCIGFKVGIETGNAEMLRRVRKPGSLKTFRALARRALNYPEIFVGGNFIVGFPNETVAEVMDTLAFIIDIQLDWNAITVCQMVRGASAFADFEDYFKEQLASGGKNVKNFIPTRQSDNGTLSEDTTHRHCLDVFDLDPTLVPDERQVQEIWFTFNLVGNFIFNKNISPGGHPDKYVGWVEMAQMAYPKNPYMSLFAALGHLLLGNAERARVQHQNALVNAASSYWEERFDAFGLTSVLQNFPETAEGCHAVIAAIRERTAKRLPFPLPTHNS
ncbi:B12-binding domain-containing radical SAM protein [Humidesulfovibrio sp.]